MVKKKVRLSRQSQAVSYAVILGIVLLIYGVTMGIIWVIAFVTELLK